mgnify:FL=1
MLITFYEKPGCGGNSRQKNALVGLGHILDVKNLLAEKWERGELRKYFGNKQLSDWFNMTAPAIKDGIVKPADLDEDGALEAMLKDPLLIKRPLMKSGEKMMSGFDPVEIQEIFGFDVSAQEACSKKDKCLNPELAVWLESKGFGLDIDKQYTNGDTPLITACRDGNLQIAKLLIEAGADKNKRNNDFTNPLWAACFSDNIELIGYLVDAGVDINNQNVNGATCLIYAASAKKENVVNILIQKGADRSLSTLDGFTALDSASTREILEMLKK